MLTEIIGESQGKPRAGKETETEHLRRGGQDAKIVGQGEHWLRKAQLSNFPTPVFLDGVPESYVAQEVQEFSRYGKTQVGFGGERPYPGSH